MANLARLLSDTAARHADRPAVRLDDATLTYAQLDEAVSRFAGLLTAKGIGPGDRVGVMLPNVPAFPVVYYAVLRVGGTVVPMNVLLKERETSFYLTDPGAALVVAWQDVAAAAQAGAKAAGIECVVVSPDGLDELVQGTEPVSADMAREGSDTAVILYTSGTTGTPKGAELTHDNLYENAKVSCETLFEFDEHDVVLGALPLFHAFGQTCALNAAVYAGSLLTMLSRFEPGAGLATIARDKVTVFEGVPTMFNAFLNHPKRGSTTPPACGCAARGVRRCRWRCCAASRRRSAAPCSRATGCRRPHRSPRSTIRTRPASPVPSAPRSPASR
jgi:long-chain acyl-CoA synthetase